MVTGKAAGAAVFSAAALEAAVVGEGATSGAEEAQATKKIAHKLNNTTRVKRVNMIFLQFKQVKFG
jgi:hypothetical protein